MLDFLQISIKHKQEMENIRKMEEKASKEPTSTSSLSSEDTDAVINEQLKKTTIHDEAKELYGDSSEKILSMETATQLSYERSVKRFNPIFWPCIPLNL